MALFSSGDLLYYVLRLQIGREEQEHMAKPIADIAGNSGQLKLRWLEPPPALVLRLPSEVSAVVTLARRVSGGEVPEVAEVLAKVRDNRSIAVAIVGPQPPHGPSLH